MTPAEGPSSRDGSTLGRYRILRRLAVGGMAEVFLARYHGVAGFERPVVLKRVHSSLVNQPGYVDMFLTEARIAARLSHPNICQVYDLGEADGSYFLAMELLEGVPLLKLIAALSRSGLPTEPRLAAAVLTQACEGLHHAHELRGDDGRPLEVVHRDCGPQNIFVTTSGAVKVLDFGIASFAFRDPTRSGVVKGTYSYMSPEQLKGTELDRRSDVFTLGVVLNELIAQKPLFQRETDYLTSDAITRAPMPRTPIPPDAPALAVAADRALLRDRDKRTPTARAMGLEIAAAVHRLGGPMPWAQLGDTMTKLCAPELAEQRAKIGLPGGAPPRAPTPPRAAIPSRPRAASEPEDATEVASREALAAALLADSQVDDDATKDERGARPKLIDGPDEKTSQRLAIASGDELSIETDAEPITKVEGGGEAHLEEPTEMTRRPVSGPVKVITPPSAQPVSPMAQTLAAPPASPSRATLPPLSASVAEQSPSINLVPAARSVMPPPVPRITPNWQAQPNNPPRKRAGTKITGRQRRLLAIGLVGGSIGLMIAAAVLGRAFLRDSSEPSGLPTRDGGTVYGGTVIITPDAAPAPSAPVGPERPMQPARIRVGGKPGREVEIDGNPVGRSPLIEPVVPGRHVVRVDKGAPVDVEVTLGATVTVP